MGALPLASGRGLWGGLWGPYRMLMSPGALMDSWQTSVILSFALGKTHL